MRELKTLEKLQLYIQIYNIQYRYVYIIYTCLLNFYGNICIFNVYVIINKYIEFF